MQSVAPRPRDDIVQVQLCFVPAKRYNDQSFNMIVTFSQRLRKQCSGFSKFVVRHGVALEPVTGAPGPTYDLAASAFEYGDPMTTGDYVKVREM